MRIKPAELPRIATALRGAADTCTGIAENFFQDLPSNGPKRDLMRAARECETSAATLASSIRLTHPRPIRP
jgi:hypothetical protein